jgi:hypothetical protein
MKSMNTVFAGQPGSSCWRSQRADQAAGGVNMQRPTQPSSRLRRVLARENKQTTKTIFTNLQKVRTICLAFRHKNKLFLFAAPAAPVMR